VSALAFTLVALALVGPVPAMLARASWPLRAPRAAIVLWQSIALAAVLSAFSAGIAIASRLFVPGPDGRPTATVSGEIAALGLPLWLTYVVVFTLTLFIGARLCLAVVQVAIATRRRRAHHRMMVDLLGRSRDGLPPHLCSSSRMHLSRVHLPLVRGGGLRILDVAEPLAYCLPGVRSRVVVSKGTLTTLSDSEITAILTHERAHLRARHDLVLEMFTAVHAAFPRFVRSASALDAVRLLIELLADDAAVRTAGPTPLARALVACAAGPTPSGAMAAGGPTTVIRVRRLGGKPNSVPVAVTAYLTAVAVLVVPTVAVAVPWLTELRRLFTSWGG
jgi:Zn-dependent protease with chaperone function